MFWLKILSNLNINKLKCLKVYILCPVSLTKLNRSRSFRGLDKGFYGSTFIINLAELLYLFIISNLNKIAFLKAFVHIKYN